MVSGSPVISSQSAVPPPRVPPATTRTTTTPQSPQIARMQTSQAANKRQRGAGMAYVEAQLAPSSSSLSHVARNILQSLLSQHHVALPHTEVLHGTRQENDGTLPHKTRKPIDTNMSDERILQLAQEGELSFLASLLRIMEEEGGTVTTKFLIKACCLSVEPGKVPAYCDAKEMVMTALHFMSQSFEPLDTDSQYFPSLPLIEPVTTGVDLEKRAYCKTGTWKLQDIMDQVLHLETVFYDSCDKYKWIAREHCVPRLLNGRNLLLLKGSPPATCIPKTRKTSSTSARRKKPSSSGAMETTVPLEESGADHQTDKPTTSGDRSWTDAGDADQVQETDNGQDADIEEMDDEEVPVTPKESETGSTTGAGADERELPRGPQQPFDSAPEDEEAISFLPQV